MEAGVENLELRSIQRGPSAGGGVCRTDQVVDLLGMDGPADLRLRGPEPALVGRGILVLVDLDVTTRHDEVGRLQQRVHPHGEQGLEIDVAEGGVRPDLAGLLEDHRAFVEAVRRAEDGQAGLHVSPGDRPIDRGGAAVARQQARMILDRAVGRDVHERLGRELQHVGHDADIGVQVAHRAFRLRALEARELEERQALLLRCRLQDIGLGAGLLRRTEHTGYVVAPREERLKHRLAEILLTDEGDAHGASLRPSLTRGRLGVVTVKTEPPSVIRHHAPPTRIREGGSDDGAELSTPRRFSVQRRLRLSLRFRRSHRRSSAARGAGSPRCVRRAAASAPRSSGSPRA